MKFGNFHVGSRTRARNFVVDAWFLTISPRLQVSDLKTCNHGGMDLIHATVVELLRTKHLQQNPGFDSSDKISRFHHNHDVLADNSTPSLVCILWHFSFASPPAVMDHHGWHPSS